MTSLLKIEIDFGVSVNEYGLSFYIYITQSNKTTERSVGSTLKTCLTKSIFVCQVFDVTLIIFENLTHDINGHVPMNTL